MNASMPPLISEECKKRERALSDAYFKARRILALTWAADQLLLENSDNTIDQLELTTRVSYLLEAARDEADSLAKHCDGGYRDDHDKEDD